DHLLEALPALLAVVLGHLHTHRAGLAVVKDLERDGAARWRLAHHARQLHRAFDTRSLVFEDHIAGLQPGLLGGTAGHDRLHLGARLLLELQLPDTIAGDVRDADPEPGASGRE